MKNYEHSFMNAFVCLFLMEERLWFMQVFYSVQDLKWDQKTSTAQVKLFRPNSHFDTLNLKRAREALWGSMEICEFVIFGIFTDSLRFVKKGRTEWNKISWNFPSFSQTQTQQANYI